MVVGDGVDGRVKRERSRGRCLIDDKEEPAVVAAAPAASTGTAPAAAPSKCQAQVRTGLGTGKGTGPGAGQCFCLQRSD